MAKLLKLRRGTTSQHNSFTGAEGEVTIDTTKDTAVVHDGTTQAGRPLAREDMNNVSSAAIAGRLGTDSIATSKIAGGALPTDVTVASANIVNGTIATGDIANNAVDFTKIQDISGNRIIGRTGSSGGNPEQLTAADVRSMINVENGATADQSNAEIRAAVEAASDSNVFTDADHSKLNGIESGATADQTAAEIRTLVESASDSNVFTDADHSKLNGIESGATADQSASEILTLIKTVDGSGSGLDADTLDGLNAAQTGNSSRIVKTNSSGYIFANFFNTTANDVSSGVTKIMVETGNDNYIRHGSAAAVRSFINVADGATNVTNNNQLTNGAGYTTYTSNQATNTNSNVTFGTINCSSLTASGNVTAFSDSRLKTEIHTIKNPLEKVDRLRGVTFKWLHTDKPSSGVIAQEVQEVFPELVESTTHEGKEVLSVDYGKLVGVLIESIKELKAEFEAHKAECAKQHGGE